MKFDLQRFRGFSGRIFKHRFQRAQNSCACHAKSILSDPLQIHHACQRFCNPHELLRLPRILQRVEIPAPATRKALRTSKNAPRHSVLMLILTSKSLSRHNVVQILLSRTSKRAPKPSIFKNFDFQIVLAPERGANFAKLNFQKCSEPKCFHDFEFQIALAPWRDADFAELNFQKCSEHAGRRRFVRRNRSRATAWCKFRRHLAQPSLRTTSLFGADFASLRGHRTMEKHGVSCKPYPPKSLTLRICAVKRLCNQTSMLQDLPATFSIVGS